jgi:peroxiredoxin
MKKILIAVVAVVIAVAAAATTFAASNGEQKFGPNVGDKMMAFKLSDPTDGKEYALADLASGGNDVAIVFMQTACSLCVSEITELVGAADDLKGKLNVALVSLDIDSKRIKPYKDGYNIPFPILHDKEAAVLESVKFAATPAIVVVDGKGIIKKKVDGYNKAELKGIIKAYSK